MGAASRHLVLAALAALSLAACNKGGEAEGRQGGEDEMAADGAH